MNLRGRILPVIDLRARFGLEPLAEDAQKAARIVIVDVEGITAGLMGTPFPRCCACPRPRLIRRRGWSPRTDTGCIVGIGACP
jgi:chemotaxis signal transduction protein